MKLSRSPGLKRLLFKMIVIIAVVFTNPFIYRSMVKLWQPQPSNVPALKTYEAGIVLGGMSGYDKYNRGFFGNNADRFIQTANLYHRGIIKKIIISGGTGTLSQTEPPESYFLRTSFLDNGVKDSDIIVESRSRNTFENGVFSKRIIDSLHLAPPFILITSALHMKRSVAVFKKTGYVFLPLPCDYKVTDTKQDVEDYIVPNISLLNEWSYFIKEVIGLCVYQFTGKA